MTVGAEVTPNLILKRANFNFLLILYTVKNNSSTREGKGVWEGREKQSLCCLKLAALPGHQCGLDVPGGTGPDLEALGKLIEKCNPNSSSMREILRPK
jgi:hypothetical protein